MPHNSVEDTDVIAFAMRLYLDRKTGKEQPFGIQPKLIPYGNRCFIQEPRTWTPTTLERRPCCDIIPIRGNALRAHCCGLVHVAALFGISPEKLQAAVNFWRRAEKTGRCVEPSYLLENDKTSCR